jgi:hypothetical protein
MLQKYSQFVLFLIQMVNIFSQKVKQSYQFVNNYDKKYRNNLILQITYHFFILSLSLYPQLAVKKLSKHIVSI